MENLIEAPSEVRVIGDSAACGMASCDEGAAIALRGTPLCVRHFIPVCTQEIESRGERLKNGLYDEAATLAFKNFISACAEQASRFIQDDGFTDGSDEEPAGGVSSARVAIGAAASAQPADEFFCADFSAPRGFRTHVGRGDVDDYGEPAWGVTGVPAPRGDGRSAGALAPGSRESRAGASGLLPL